MHVYRQSFCALCLFVARFSPRSGITDRFYPWRCSIFCNHFPETLSTIHSFFRMR